MQKRNSYWTHAHQQLTLFLVCENVEYEKRKQTHIMPSYLSIDSIKAPNECVQIKFHKHSTCTIYFLVIQSPSLALTIMRTTEIHCLNWFVSVTDSISDTAYSLVNGIRMSHQLWELTNAKEKLILNSCTSTTNIILSMWKRGIQEQKTNTYHAFLSQHWFNKSSQWMCPN